MIIVSACLTGVNCRYDGKNNKIEEVCRLVRLKKALPVCPEQLGGLPTPRLPSEISGGRVFNKNGDDVTKAFQKGAEEALKICLMAGCKKAILKSRSPSCGFGMIYDGGFNKKLLPGNGVFAALLENAGIKIITDENIKKGFANEII